MSSERFISGPWTGFYTYSGDRRRHRMDLALQFSNGSMTGQGTDDVGRFVVSGGYDEAAGECKWLKTYPGSHTVSYRGFAEGRGIWGTWEIGADCRGGFHIWPLGRGSEEAAEASARETLVQEATVSGEGWSACESVPHVPRGMAYGAPPRPGGGGLLLARVAQWLRFKGWCGVPAATVPLANASRL